MTNQPPDELAANWARLADGTRKLVAALVSDLAAGTLRLSGEAVRVTEEQSAARPILLELARREVKIGQFVVDADGYLRDCDPIRPEHMVLPPEEIIGRHLIDVVPPHLARPYARAIRQVKTRGRAAPVQASLRLNGRLRWEETRFAKVADRVGLEVFIIPTPERYRRHQVCCGIYDDCTTCVLRSRRRRRR